MIDYLFDEWLKETQMIKIKDKSTQISNLDLYSDILNSMKKAFEAGFYAKLKYKAEEYLQK